MKRTAWIALVVAVVVTGIMLAELRQYVLHVIPGIPATERVEYYKLAVEIFNAILVGFGAALFGILFPAILAESRSSFERLKDSRHVYSEAKTAGDYLAIRLCTMDLRDAAEFVQRAHVYKHAAELYPELRGHLKQRGIRKTAAQWGDGLYHQYFIVRELLEDHTADWGYFAS